MPAGRQEISELVGRVGDHGLDQLLVEGYGGGVGEPARGHVEGEGEGLTYLGHNINVSKTII